MCHWRGKLFPRGGFYVWPYLEPRTVDYLSTNWVHLHIFLDPWTDLMWCDLGFLGFQYSGIDLICLEGKLFRFLCFWSWLKIRSYYSLFIWNIQFKVYVSTNLEPFNWLNFAKYYYKLFLKLRNSMYCNYNKVQVLKICKWTQGHS